MQAEVWVEVQVQVEVQEEGVGWEEGVGEEEEEEGEEWEHGLELDAHVIVINYLLLLDPIAFVGHVRPTYMCSWTFMCDGRTW